MLSNNSALSGLIVKNLTRCMCFWAILVKISNIWKKYRYSCIKPLTLACWINKWAYVQIKLIWSVWQQLCFLWNVTLVFYHEMVVTDVFCLRYVIELNVATFNLVIYLTRNTSVAKVRNSPMSAMALSHRQSGVAHFKLRSKFMSTSPIQDNSAPQCQGLFDK